MNYSTTAVKTRHHSIVEEAGMVAGASLVIALLAQVAIPLPFTPVPLTLQTLGVYLVAAALGPRRGVLAVMAYILEGTAGLPVFSSGACGFMRMLGPSGGYLLGFVPAAIIIGISAQRGGKIAAGSGFVCGAIAIYFAGLLQLGHFIPRSTVLSAGLWPFMPGEIIKICIALALLPAAHKAVGKYDALWR